MDWKSAFIHTFREDPAEAELVSHRLMIRAGMIQKVASGIYDYLPLGLRVLRRIEGIIREEMNRCGAAELLMPAVIPAELWQESGRWDYYGPELLRFRDRKNNQFCLGPTHEEAIVDVARKAVRSYRDLPLCLYQIQSKFRDEVRPRYGLMRGREFIMKDAYSFHADEECLDRMYWRMHAAYRAIFKRCGLEFRSVEADSGTIGGDVTHEFHVLADSGEDTIACCDACGYAANTERATSLRNEEFADMPSDAPAPELVETPGRTSIEEVTEFLGIMPQQTVKMLVYRAMMEGEEGRLIGVCIRGDLELNEAKLRSVLGADLVEIPDEEKLKFDTGLPVGFLGAHDLDRSKLAEVLADQSVKAMADCVCGANKPDYHLRHVYPERDLRIDRYADIGFVSAGEICPGCRKGKLLLSRGIEVGQVFKLGRKYSKSMNMTVLTEQNTRQFVTMGCYGIGVGRTAAAAIEQNHDKDGIIWPAEIAPFAVAILCLDAGDAEVMGPARSIHDRIEEAGVDVVLDDRSERPGVKFKDADLIGFPVRVVVGSRGMSRGIVEVKTRSDGSMEEVAVESAADWVVEHVNSLLELAPAS